MRISEIDVEIWRAYIQQSILITYDSSEKILKMCMHGIIHVWIKILFFFLSPHNSQFGFYNSNETVVEMKQQDVSWSKNLHITYLYDQSISLMPVLVIYFFSLVVPDGCVWTENTWLQRRPGPVCFLGCWTH